MDTMRSVEVCETIGCSFRQLDYLTRTGAVDGMNRGSGSRRRWPLSTVVRLAIARFIIDVGPSTNDVMTPFPEIARAALDPMLPPPPRRGYAVLTGDPPAMIWAASWADLRRVVDEHPAALIVRYDLDNLVGNGIDLSDVTT